MKTLEDIRSDLETVVNKNDLDAAIIDIAGDLKTTVASIEKGIKTTQNHYGRYMALFANSGLKTGPQKDLLALALVKAGANAGGVENARGFA